MKKSIDYTSNSSNDATATNTSSNIFASDNFCPKLLVFWICRWNTTASMETFAEK